MIRRLLMFWIKKESENATVTDYYLQIIGEALEQLNDSVVYSYEWSEIQPGKGDTVVVCTAIGALRMYLKGVKYYFWAQGVWPEESNMRHHSNLRFRVCVIVEKFALKNAEFVFMVSETMKSYYEGKYKIDFSNRYLIMPCSNDEMHVNSFHEDYKYKNNVFCYAGGTSVWQCFEETIELYSKIERRVLNAKLLLLVREKRLALECLEKYGVKNYEIDFVTVDQLSVRLKGVKFGFVLRKESPVNYVATPTKLLTYLSNGIIPIYSSSLAGVSGILKDTNYKIEYQNDGNIDQIIMLSNEAPDGDSILKEYMNVYSEKYDKKRHIQRIRESVGKYAYK